MKTNRVLFWNVSLEQQSGKHNRLLMLLSCINKIYTVLYLKGIQETGDYDFQVNVVALSVMYSTYRCRSQQFASQIDESTRICIKFDDKDDDDNDDITH